MSEILEIAIPTAVGTSIFGGFIQWGSLKATVNGLIPRFNNMEEKLDAVVEDVAYLKGRHALDDSERSA